MDGRRISVSRRLGGCFQRFQLQCWQCFGSGYVDERLSNKPKEILNILLDGNNSTFHSNASYLVPRWCPTVWTGDNLAKITRWRWWWTMIWRSAPRSRAFHWKSPHCCRQPARIRANRNSGIKDLSGTSTRGCDPGRRFRSWLECGRPCSARQVMNIRCRFLWTVSLSTATSSYNLHLSVQICCVLRHTPAVEDLNLQCRTWRGSSRNSNSGPNSGWKQLHSAQNCRKSKIQSQIVQIDSK